MAKKAPVEALILEYFDTPTEERLRFYRLIGYRLRQSGAIAKKKTAVRPKAVKSAPEAA